ncbi:MAG: 23S rRNA (pseudouridine(1915)-N(3))-methyltransferase RlmH [Gammaproteobacteria bacterium]|nr:23S rRNA (pseudouridine(1915)-N(3))-methyltransferase RlmH [Gammaproteobacteria bacterium]
MRITILAIGTRLPEWVYEGFRVYQQRMPRDIRLDLEEIPLVSRTSKGRPGPAVQKEGERLLRRMKQQQLMVALDQAGDPWTSAELAARLQEWLQRHPRIALVIGGPDGLSAACKQRADLCWSLSPLTLPHGLVRVVVAEQLYRAWTMLQGHPYPRA